MVVIVVVGVHCRLVPTCAAASLPQLELLFLACEWNAFKDWLETFVFGLTDKKKDFACYRVDRPEWGISLGIERAGQIIRQLRTHTINILQKLLIGQYSELNTAFQCLAIEHSHSAA